MEIRVAELPRDGVRLRASEPAEIVDVGSEEALFEKPIDVDVFAQVVGDTLLVRGTISARPRLRCSRCLEYYEYILSQAEYTFSTTVHNTDIIDLTESIREDIIIALPLKPLCSGDCKGLCPKCGRNLNEGACNCSASEAGSFGRGVSLHGRTEEEGDEKQKG